LNYTVKTNKIVAIVPGIRRILTNRLKYLFGKSAISSTSIPVISDTLAEVIINSAVLGSFQRDLKCIKARGRIKGIIMPLVD
jgi:hypothetical protein